MDFFLSLFTDFSLLMNNEIIFFGLVLLMVFLAEKRPEKRKKILFALLITALLIVVLKNAFAIERPCIASPSEYGCPSSPLTSSSFPSGHASIAFVLMIAFLNKPSFPVFWVFALLIAASRIFLGVHTFEDIAGAIVLAPIAYYITDVIWRRYFERNK